jgi:hypothetical protein
MKLNHLLNNDKPGRIVRKFGEAKLIKHADGKHELVGGTASDIADANDWVSLFAHEVVLTRSGVRPAARREDQPKGLAFRFRPRLAISR